MQEAKDKKFDAVLLYKLDRLGREEDVLFEARTILRTLGVKLVGVAESLEDDTNASGRMVMGVKTVMAAFVCNDVVERSIKGSH